MFIIFLYYLVQTYFSRIIEYNFTITNETIYPDNIPTSQVLVNKQFPGPEIRATTRDTIIVNVRNMISEDFIMHFNGIHGVMNSHNGLEMATQKGIKKDATHQYIITANDQSGTYYYYGHNYFHAKCAFGALIIEDHNEYNQLVKYNNKYEYEEERLLILSDYFRKPGNELLELGLKDKFLELNKFEAVLTNGQTYANSTSYYSQSLASSNFGYYVMDVDAMKTYRLRIICASTLSYFNFYIPDHNLTIIEVDGLFVDPVNVDYLKINSGQRYSVLLTTNKKPENYYMTTRVDGRHDPMNGYSILHYKNSPSTKGLVKTTPVVPIKKAMQFTDEWVYSILKTSQFYAKHKNNTINSYSKKADKTIELDATSKSFKNSIRYTVKDVVLGNDKILKYIHNNSFTSTTFQFNRTTFSFPNDRTLEHFNNNINYNFPGIQKVYEGDVVDIILTGYVSVNGNCFEYPWHLQGHSFYEMGSGSGSFNKQTNLLNKKDQPFLRDTTTTLPKNQNELKFGDACGWKVIRFVAKNLGAWLIEGHYNIHRLLGMQSIILVLPKPITKHGY